MYIMWIFLLQQHLRYVVLFFAIAKCLYCATVQQQTAKSIFATWQKFGLHTTLHNAQETCANAKTQRPLRTTIGKLLCILRAVAKKTLQETCVPPANAPTLSTSQLHNTQFLKEKHLENSFVAPFNCNRHNKSPQSTFPQETRQAGGFFS